MKSILELLLNATPLRECRSELGCQRKAQLPTARRIRVESLLESLITKTAGSQQAQ